MRTIGVCAAVLVVATLSACANPDTAPRTPTAGSSTRPAHATGVCDRTFPPGVPVPPDPTSPTAPTRQREPLPAGFKPVLLITCRLEDRTTTTDGMWTYLLEQQATQGLDSVVAALRATPPPAPKGPHACTMERRFDPWFLLVDSAGRQVLPVVPHDNVCGKPIDVGISRLDLTTVKATKWLQQASPAELATNCSGQFKSPRVLSQPEPQDATSTRTVTATPTQVCVYRSGDSDVGKFVGGTQLTAASAARVGSLLTGEAGDSGACHPAGDFAVVFAGGDWYIVEMSGCQRLVLDAGRTYTAPVPRLVAAIKALPLQR